MVVEFHLSNASFLPSTRRWHSLEEHKGMIDRKYDGQKRRSVVKYYNCDFQKATTQYLLYNPLRYESTTELN